MDSRPIALESSANASNVVSLRTASTEAIERAVKASRGDPFETPAGLCPKCVSKRAPDDAACPFCGLNFEGYDPKTLRPPEWLIEPWRELLLTWGNEAEHAHVRTLALQQNGLPELGRLYRLRLADFAEDPFAARARDELLRQATQAVSYKAPDLEDDRTPPWKYVMAVLMLIGAFGLSWAILKFVLDTKP